WSNTPSSAHIEEANSDEPVSAEGGWDAIRLRIARWSSTARRRSSSDLSAMASLRVLVGENVLERRQLLVGLQHAARDHEVLRVGEHRLVDLRRLRRPLQEALEGFLERALVHALHALLQDLHDLLRMLVHVRGGLGVARHQLLAQARALLAGIRARH